MACATFRLLMELPAFMVALATLAFKGGRRIAYPAIGITLKLVHRESCSCELNFSLAVANPAKKIGRLPPLIAFEGETVRYAVLASAVKWKEAQLPCPKPQRKL